MKRTSKLSIIAIFVFMLSEITYGNQVGLSNLIILEEYQVAQTTGPSIGVTLPPLQTTGPAITAVNMPPIISVDLPTDVSMIIDPYNINGEGQIISEDIVFKNNSEIPININLKSCNLILSDTLKAKRYFNNEVRLYIKEKSSTNKVEIKNGEINESFGEIEKEGEVKRLNLVGTIDTSDVTWIQDDAIKAALVFTIEPRLEKGNK